MSDANTSAAIKYGDVTLYLSALPTASVVALASRGLAHYLGNEGASAVSSKKEAFAKDNGGAEPDESTVAGWKAEELSARVARITEGTIGQNSRGPRGTAVDTIARRIAVSELTANLAKSKIKFPTGKETVALPGADGSVRHWTRNEMIDYRLAHPVHGPKIKKAAQREFDNLNKQAAGAAEGGNPLDA